MTDDLAATLRLVIGHLEAEGMAYMVVGSLAALAHGHARSTHDFDIVIETDEAAVKRVVAALSPKRFYVSEGAALDAVRRQTLFNVIDMETGWKVDLVPRKRRPFSIEELSRRQQITVLGLNVWVATIEDTIVSKLEWAKRGGGSKRQLEDVAALVRAAGDRLDADYIEKWSAELGVAEAWASIVEAWTDARLR
ncbi:MAG: DUF6036 family nucleotidyltransferase [Myxococcota bacterium]